MSSNRARRLHCPMSGSSAGRGTRSILFSARTTGPGPRASRVPKYWSPPPTASVASATAQTTSAWLMLCTATSTIRTFRRCSGRWMPGVSMNTIWPPSPLRTPRMRVRVVCGLSETIATFWPTSRFSSVDLPALGRPTSATKPAFMRIAPRPGNRESRAPGPLRRRAPASTRGRGARGGAPRPGFPRRDRRSCGPRPPPARGPGAP